MALPVRKSYKGAPVSTTLSALLGAGSTSCTVGSVTGWPTTFPFYIVIEPGTSREEKVRVTGATGTTLTIVRAQDDTTAVEHPSASTVYVVFTALEADEANQIASAMTTKGDLVTTDGSTINRLAVGGTNTHVLQVDSTATNGIKWGQVATAGIADSAVTSAKIADGTIATDDLADGAVTSAKIADGTIVDADVSASAAIALSKLATGALPTSITVASANIVDGTITASDTNFGGAWTAFTPTCSNTTVTASDCRYQVIGKTAFVSIMLQTTGTSTSTFQTLGGLPAAITPRGWSGFQEWKVIGSGSFSTVNHGFWYVKRDGTLEYRSAYAPGASSYYVTFTGTQILGTVYLTGNLVYEIA